MLASCLNRGHSRPGRATSKSGHVRYVLKATVAMKRHYQVPRVAFLFTGGDIAHVHAHHFAALHPRRAIDVPTASVPA